jgi:hypothetical protein
MGECVRRDGGKGGFVEMSRDSRQNILGVGRAISRSA